MARITLNYEPRKWQQVCHESMRRFNVLVLHRRAGKTELALMELLDRALKCDKELGAFVYITPHLKQAKAVAWARLKEIIRDLVPSGHVVINESELSVQIAHNKALIRLFGADNPDALRGLRLDFAVLDEVAQMRSELWFEVVRPALADREGGALFIGTVKKIDLFSQIYFQGLKHVEQGREDWFVGLWTCYETEGLTEAEIQNLRDNMSEQAFAREMLCDFTAQGDDQLIALSDIHVAAKRSILPADIMTAPIVLGVDGARFGNDRSVIVRRQGLQMFEPIALRNMDNMALAARVSQEIEAHQPDAVFVDAADSGVIDRLRQLGYSITEVPFGGRSAKPQLYVNKRTEMWFGVRDWLDAGGSIPDHLALKQELGTPTYEYNTKGVQVLESKDQIRTRLPDAGSPDIADALALTFAANVQARNLHADYNPQHPYAAPVASRRRKKKEHNPFVDYRS